MAKIKFKSINFTPRSLPWALEGHTAKSLIDECNDIINVYQAQELRLTLRQLYYQLVTRNLIRNVERSYKNLSRLLTDGRLAGLVDWDAIEDRIRQPVVPGEWNTIQDLVESALRAFRLPRWEGQDTYAELWVEKDALAGVLRPLASEFHVTLMVNRGYSSSSAMFDSAQRFDENRGKDHVLFYLGDHDPSGEDMVRDVRDRLEMFGIDARVEKIALTREQVDEFNPPPNPAKMTDPRADKYVAEHGAVSWEVDALPPEELARIVRRAFRSVVDQDAMDEVKGREETLKEKLRKAAKRIEA